jgi:hypothetical protein
MEFIRGKHSSKGKHVSDAVKLKNFVAYHRQCRRQEHRRWVNGAYVENEMIWAVADQNRIIINVAHASQPRIAVHAAKGEYVPFHSGEAQDSPFFLWCTGGHYQALVCLADVEVLPGSLLKRSFIDGNVLRPDDLRIPFQFD